MDQDETWHGGRPRPRPHCVRYGPSSYPSERGMHSSPNFSAHVYRGQTAGWIKMPPGTEVGLSPGHMVLDWNPAPSTEKGTVRLCGFLHIYTFDLGVDASRASFFAVFCNFLHQISRLSTIRVAFDVKRCSPTLFQVLPKSKVVSNGRSVADSTILK